MRLLSAFLLTLFLFSAAVQAQLRSEQVTPFDYSGPVVNTKEPTVQSGLQKFFRSFDMSHSYEMSFQSFGGNAQNINAYTNTMTFAFSPNLMGRVDVSFLHSPFGGNMMGGQNQLANQVVIRNAELNYRISDKAFIRFQYQQMPRGVFPGMMGNGLNHFDNRRPSPLFW
jgi:hypothetical protein